MLFKDSAEGIDPKYVHPPMIITVALTGAVPMKSRYPNLPISPREIAETALECATLGASTVHLHMRDKFGQPANDPEALLETIRLIRSENKELIICATSTSRGSRGLNDRLSPLKLTPEFLPDMLSLTLGSYNTPYGVNLNPKQDIEVIAAEMKKVNVLPEIEIFEPGMVATLRRMMHSGIIERPAIANVLLGVDGASPANVRSLIQIVDLLPLDLEWAVAGVGLYQKHMIRLGAILGGNVRVGMEDDPRGEFEGWSNADSIRRARSIAEQSDRRIASPSEARTRLGLAAS